MSNILQVITQLITGAGEGSSGVVDWAGEWLTLIGSNSTLILFCIALPLSVLRASALSHRPRPSPFCHRS